MDIKSQEGELLMDAEDVKERKKKYWEELGKAGEQEGILSGKSQRK